MREWVEGATEWFNKYLLALYFTPDTSNSVVGKVDVRHGLWFHGAYSLLRERMNKWLPLQIHKVTLLEHMFKEMCRVIQELREGISEKKKKRAESQRMPWNELWDGQLWRRMRTFYGRACAKVLWQEAVWGTSEELKKAKGNGHRLSKNERTTRWGRSRGRVYTVQDLMGHNMMSQLLWRKWKEGTGMKNGR